MGCEKLHSLSQVFFLHTLKFGVLQKLVRHDLHEIELVVLRKIVDSVGLWIAACQHLVDFAFFFVCVCMCVCVSDRVGDSVLGFFI